MPACAEALKFNVFSCFAESVRSWTRSVDPGRAQLESEGY